MFGAIFKNHGTSGGKRIETGVATSEDVGTDEVAVVEVSVEESKVTDTSETQVDEDRVTETTQTDKKESVPETGGEQGDSSLANLFTGTEEGEESNLGKLLELIPDATVDELINDLEEIKELLKGRLDEPE